jgi:two-component system CheB/CheR fusion protein
VGRSIAHFASVLVDVSLAELAGAVLDDLVVRERALKTTSGRFLLLKARPYRTTDNVSDGIVLTFEDRTEISLVQERLQRVAGKLPRRAATNQRIRAERSGDEPRRKR